jgi:hypothetical protein
MQRIGKSGGVQGINEETSQARSLLSLVVEPRVTVRMGPRGIWCVCGLTEALSYSAVV